MVTLDFFCGAFLVFSRFLFWGLSRKGASLTGFFTNFRKIGKGSGSLLASPFVEVRSVEKFFGTANLAMSVCLALLMACMVAAIS